MAMMKFGTPARVINKVETELLSALETLSFTLKTASEEECQKALSAALKRHISISLVKEFISKAKEQ